MALSLFGWNCRRSACLSTLFRYNKIIQNQHVTRRKTPLTCVMSGVMYSSDSERRNQNHKVVVVGIPNPVLWFRTRIYFFLIRAYFDKDFDIQEFTNGAKQAFSHVSHLISQFQFDALEGLVAENLIGKLEEQCATLPLNYKRALFAERDEIMYALPGDVGFYYDNGRKFVSILMRFWYLTSSRLPDETAEGARIFQVAIGGNGQKPETKRLLTANYEFQREFTQGVTPDWTITRIEHSTWLKL